MSQNTVASYCSDVSKFLEFFDTPERKVPADRLNAEDINEYLVRCGKQAVLEVITHAQDSPVPSVEDFSDIQEVDMADIDGINIGISEVDKELMRFFYGSFNIISGTPGAGKTSILNQFIAQALDQGCDCWLYSKELPKVGRKI